MKHILFTLKECPSELLDDATKYPNANKALSNVFFVGCPPHYGEEVFAYYESVMQKWVC